ncbi:MAG: APC family permease, partial [Anaerolineales bacterium]|nr:APC family permease [Anaerolineales bacterium]
VVSWVDVSIYPVLAAYYLSYFIPALNDGAVILGMEIPGWVFSWLVALVLIWAISYLNVRGARLAGLTTDWLGVIMLTPLIIMTGVGIYAWITQGSNFEFVFLPHAAPVTMENLIPAFSVGMFVVMWNYMGWELPAAAGDEIVNPKRTYPLAMVLVLFAAVATYALPVTASLFGGAGEDGRYLVWGMEASDAEAGLVVDVAATDDPAVVAEYADKMTAWGVDPASEYGWEFPQIAHAIGAKASGNPDGFLAKFLGTSVMIAAVLSMIGLFIGNGLGGTRIPFALAEDGMMPRWMVKVHPKYGTPWVAILFCGILFSVFSLQAFAFLVVVDVFLNMVVLCLCFFALWVLRFKFPDRSRKAVPGGWIGLAVVTILPTAIFLFAIYSQVVDVGWASVGMALGAIALGAILYFPIRRYIKPGVPDIDPFVAPAEEE